jgi:hypothetical protein
VQPVIGVTTALSKGLPHPAFAGAAAKAAGKYVANHWDDLVGMSPGDRQEAVAGAWFSRSRTAMARGRDIHEIGERLAAGEPVDVPDALLGPAQAYVRWLDLWDVKVMHAERPVLSRRWQYGGTFDLIAEIGEQVWLLDIKTGDAVYSDVALQLAAYRYADVLLTAEGEEIPMPTVDRCGVIHILADDALLLPVDTEQHFQPFLYVLQVARYLQQYDRDHSPVGQALRPPNEPTTRLQVVR